MITFFRDMEMPLYLLLIYAKAQRDNFSPDEKRRIREMVAEIKRTYGRR